jgi:hypothetical protein
MAKGERFIASAKVSGKAPKLNIHLPSDVAKELKIEGEGKDSFLVYLTKDAVILRPVPRK